MAKKKFNIEIPAFHQLMIPTLKAIKKLGGSGTIEEINEEVYQISNIGEEILQITHNENGLQSEIDYRLAWSRTYLKKYGLLSNSTRGVWALSNSDLNIDLISSDEIVKTVREQNKDGVKVKNNENISDESEDFEGSDSQTDWKEELLQTLLQISPDAFERLSQRLLRESGFTQVEVTGQTGDGGIDGKGIVKIIGFLSFHIIFQCKRYKGSVSPSQIRDFRGAMQGRADKGLFITTGTFTREAIKEATRDGAPPIDLIDGDLLCEKLKEFNLGTETELIEEVRIKKEWFSKL